MEISYLDQEIRKAKKLVISLKGRIPIDWSNKDLANYYKLLATVKNMDIPELLIKGEA
tara:strand:- start:463 stop:636 length:174 start_codon:yes stop_codon:yes gene_type:complete